MAYTLHLGEVNLILAALAGADLMGRRDGGWQHRIATGLAAGIKLTPLIFIAYLAITRRAGAVGGRPGPMLLLESSLYVLCGLAVLAGAALALTRERAVAARARVRAAFGWLVT